MRHRGSASLAGGTCAGIVASLLLVTGHAHASEERPRARLAYDAKVPGCPDETSVRATIRTRLGYDPFRQEADSSRVVDLRIEPRGKTLVGRVDIRNGITSLGARELTSEDCAELVSSLGVTIAVGIDPLSLTGPVSPPASADVTNAPPPAAHGTSSSNAESPFPDLPPPAQPKSVDAAGARLQVHAGPIVALGAAPAASAGVAAGARARWQSLSLGAEGRLDLPVATHVATGGAVSASVLLGSVVPCFHFRTARGCALVSGGVLRASGEGVTTPKRTTEFFSALGARAGVELPVGEHLAVGGHADLLATVTRITLRLDGRDVWTTPAASVAGGIDLTGTF